MTSIPEPFHTCHSKLSQFQAWSFTRMDRMAPLEYSEHQAYEQTLELLPSVHVRTPISRMKTGFPFQFGGLQRKGSACLFDRSGKQGGSKRAQMRDTCSAMALGQSGV